MTKGMIFVGCSFTWGQGLYYYSKMDTIKPPPPYEFIDSYLTDAHKNYMYSKRFARLVANHFDTFEITKRANYGCDEQSLHFLDTVFDRKNTYEWNHTLERYDYSEVGYVILQTSHFLRNSFKFTLDNEEYYSQLTKDKFELINKLMIEKEYGDVEEVLNFFIKDYFNKIKTKFVELESKGVKCRMLCWYDDYIKYINEDEYMKERFIPLIYDNNQFDTIFQLIDYNKNFDIKLDYEFFGEVTPTDSHPSKKCHRVIADSIIRKIESEYQ